MAGVNNNNNPSLHLNSRRLIQTTPTKEIVEKGVGNGDDTPTSPTLARGVDPDMVSWLALDQHLLLEMRNIKIVSTVKSEPAVKADSTLSAGGTWVNGGSKTDSTNGTSGSGKIVTADTTTSVSGTSDTGSVGGTDSTNGTNGVVQADGTQSASGAGVNGTGGMSGTVSTSGTSGVVQADGTTSVSGASGTSGTSTGNTVNASEELQNFETRINNGEFNSIRYDSDEFNNYINTYLNLIKADLKSKNYSDDYIESILNFAKDDYGYDLTLTSVLNNIKNKTNELKESPVLYNIWNRGSENEFNMWETDGLYINWIMTYINDHKYSHNVGERYFANMFTNIFDRFGLNKEEQEAFVNMIFTEIANKIGKSTDGELRFTLTDLEKLNINGKSGYLDELFALISEKARNIVHMEEDEWQSATSLNFNELFKAGNINAEYIERHLSEMLLSKDPSIRKLANMINEALNNNNCNTKKAREDYIKWLLVLINEQNGIQHPKNDGMLFVGEISCPVVLANGTSTTITIQVTAEDNVRALTQEDAEQYVRDHIEEFIERWSEENHEQIVSHHPLPQMDIDPAQNEDTANGPKKYWTGSFCMRVTLEDGTSQYIAIQITVNDKIVAGGIHGVENYIRENMGEYLSRWESSNINQFITSWDDLSCNAMSQGTVYEYTQDKLKEYGLSDWEIAVYFHKLNDGTYIMQTGKIDKQFPGMYIRDLDYLRSVLNYAGPTANNIYLTQSELSELGDNIFDKIDAILHSQKLKNCYNADVDGIIDNFKQGGNGTGDCWLLSGIAAINAIPDGQALFKNCIRWNSDYTAITVTFPGTNESVEITIEELLNADPDLGSGKYNEGDNDVLALVLAYEKLYGDIKGDYGDTFFKKFLPFLSRDIDTTGLFEGKGLDDLVNLIGGLFGWPFRGGGRIDLSTGTVYEYLQNILNAKNNGQNVAATFSLFTGGNTKYRWTTVDGQEGYAGVYHGDWADWGGHVFAITDVTATTVTFINPWDSSKSYTVTWSEFANIGIGDISWATWGNHAPVTG